MATTESAPLFSFFGLQKNPFNVSPDLRFYFSTCAQELALAELLFAIQTQQGLMLLSGEAGAGKTTLLHQLLDTLRRRGVSSSYIFHSRLDADDLFHFILSDFGIPCVSRRKGDVLQVLHTWLMQRHIAGDTPVIVIDEAQVLPVATLDELRLLLNLEAPSGKLVQIVLAGQPELEEKLHLTELRQLRQRVMFRCRLPLLTLKETSSYLQSRLVIAGLLEPELFPEETVAAIFNYSKGIPRTVNLLGEHALINAYAEQKRTISPEDILYIASDFDLVENPLSLGAREKSTETNRLVHFPLPSPEPGSLSALRLAFVSAEPMPKNAPAAVASASQAGPSLVLEEALPFPLPPEPASEEEPSIAHLTEPPLAPSLEDCGRAVAAESGGGTPDAPASPASLAVSSAGPGAIHGSEKLSRRSSFNRYWSDVARSFRCDARAFYSDCASIFRGKRVSSNGASPRR